MQEEGLKIISDGTIEGTRVYHDGKQLGFITRLELIVDAINPCMSRCTITLSKNAIEFGQPDQHPDQPKDPIKLG